MERSAAYLRILRLVNACCLCGGSGHKLIPLPLAAQVMPHS